MKKFLCFIVTLTATAVAPAFADIDINGQFNPGGSTNPPGFTTLAGGSTAIADWTVTGDSVDWIGNYWQAPPTGGYSVDLDGNAPGGITQSVDLGAGSYTLSYYVAGNPDGAPSIKDYSVTTGSLTTAMTFDDTGNTKNNMGYVQETVDFTVATPSFTTIAFASTDNPASAYGAVIGGVSLSQVPEPGFYYQSAAYALGLSGFLMFVRRKRQSL